MRTCLCLLIALLISQYAWARPEYATKEKLNCMSCHVTPWGGGPRSVYGKTYGAHGHEPTKLSSLDAVYADLRALGYYPTEKTTQSTNGLALMQASATGNALVIQKENGTEVRGLLTYNIAPVAAAEVREAYVRVQAPTPAEKRAQSAQLLVGRFYVPFGLLTDEHRTYTRLQTNSSLNAYNVGIGASASPCGDTRVDAALVNDLHGKGTFNEGNLTWATVANARWNPRDLPFLIGASGSFERASAAPDPYAYSLYGVFAYDRLSLSFERVAAKNWNNPTINTGGSTPGLSTFFFSDPNSAARLSQARTIGYYVLAKLELFSSLVAFYKLDWLDLDASKSGERFSRHGAGLEAYLPGNIILNARYEKAYTGDAQSRATNSLAALDDVIFMLRFWL